MHGIASRILIHFYPQVDNDRFSNIFNKLFLSGIPDAPPPYEWSTNAEVMPASERVEKPDPDRQLEQRLRNLRTEDDAGTDVE